MTEDKKLEDGPALKLDRKPKQPSMAMPAAGGDIDMGHSRVGKGIKTHRLLT